MTRVQKRNHSSLRPVHDVARICVLSKDAQKQLARTSLNQFLAAVRKAGYAIRDNPETAQISILPAWGRGFGAALRCAVHSGIRIKN